MEVRQSSKLTFCFVLKVETVYLHSSFFNSLCILTETKMNHYTIYKEKLVVLTSKKIAKFEGEETPCSGINV